MLHSYQPNHQASPLSEEQPLLCCATKWKFSKTVEGSDAYKNYFCVIEICLKSWHGVRFGRILEFVEVDFTLSIEPSNLLTSTPLGWLDLTWDRNINHRLSGTGIHLTGKVLSDPLHHGVSNPGRIFMVRDTHHTQLVWPGTLHITATPHCHTHASLHGMYLGT